MPPPPARWTVYCPRPTLYPVEIPYTVKLSQTAIRVARKYLHLAAETSGDRVVFGEKGDRPNLCEAPSGRAGKLGLSPFFRSR